MDLFEDDSKKRLDALLGDSFELSDLQKTKIKSLEKELEHKKTHEEKHRERKQATSLDTGIPYSLVDMDVVKIAIMVGMIKSKSVLEGKKKDTSMSIIDMLFGLGGGGHLVDKEEGNNIPIYYQPTSRLVSEQIKLDYHSKHIQAECRQFTTLCTAHLQHHLAEIRKTTVMDLETLTVPCYVDTCQTTLTTMLDFLEDETNKKELDELVGSIGTIRNSLLGPVSIHDYIELVKAHILTFKKFKVPKKIVAKHLSWIDCMVSLYPGFHQRAPPQADIQRLCQELEFRCHQNDPMLKPFNMYHVTRECCTPAVTCVDLEHLLSKCFVGPYRHNPVVYLPLQHGKGASASTWSFYVLKELKPNGKRLWVIDHSLVKTSDEVGTLLMAYMTHMFKTLHKAAFGDNTYRPGFLQKSAIGPLFKMLIKNMLIVNNKARFREFMACLVMKTSTLIATAEDLFNSQQNTVYTSDMLPSVQACTTNEHSLVKSLFDEASKYSLLFLHKDMKN